jgi:hypothetical protein
MKTPSSTNLPRHSGALSSNSRNDRFSTAHPWPNGRRMEPRWASRSHRINLDQRTAAWPPKAQPSTTGSCWRACLHPVVAAADDPKVTGAQEWSLPLDVTGDARYSEERDLVRATLMHLQAYDGGMLWDASTSTLTIQMTTEDALQPTRLLLLVTSPAWLRAMFVQIQYSALELREVAACRSCPPRGPAG